MSKLIDLRSHIVGITGRINDISNTTITGSLTTNEINQISGLWLSYIPNTIYSDTENLVDDIQTKIINLYISSFSFGFDDIEAYIKNQIDAFKLNEQPLVLLSGWKQELTETINNTLTEFLKTNEFVTESESVYNSIQNQKLNKADLIQKLTYKRTAINSIG